MKLTLISCADGAEYYSSGSLQLYWFKNGKWHSNMVPEYRTPQFNTMREESLWNICDSEVLTREHAILGTIVEGLFYCILPELSIPIAGYLSAIMPCTLPIPAKDVYRVCANDLNLENFHLAERNESHEIWSSGCTQFTYWCGLSMWCRQYPGRSSAVGLFHTVLLTTLRAQALGLPLRKI